MQTHLIKMKNKIKTTKIFIKCISSKHYKPFNLLKTTFVLLASKKFKIKFSIYQSLRDQSVSLAFLISLVKKLVIFDMDETLIHCVDDIET